MEEKTIKELWDEYREAKLYISPWSIVESTAVYSRKSTSASKQVLYHDDFYAKKPPNGSLYWIMQISVPEWFLYEIGVKN